MHSSMCLVIGAAALKPKPRLSLFDGLRSKQEQFVEIKIPYAIDNTSYELHEMLPKRVSAFHAAVLQSHHSRD